MADGTSKPIKNIKIGDHVTATDPTTGATSTQPVLATMDHVDTDMTDLTVSTSDGQTSTIHTTQHHPFWDDTTHNWVDAGTLAVADHLHTLTGTTLTVTAITNYTATRHMLDLTINHTHTYYVVAGDTPVLVHNCGEGNWKPTDVGGQRVYQRDDLVNPDYVSSADKYGRTNLKRMQQGLAPMGPDDNPMVLHHMLQTQDGPLAELTQSMHQGWFRQLHINVGTDIPSGIDRDAFAVWKTGYWKSRAAGFLEGASG